MSDLLGFLVFVGFVGAVWGQVGRVSNALPITRMLYRRVNAVLAWSGLTRLFHLVSRMGYGSDSFGGSYLGSGRRVNRYDVNVGSGFLIGILIGLIRLVFSVFGLLLYAVVGLVVLLIEMIFYGIGFILMSLFGFVGRRRIDSGGRSLSRASVNRPVNQYVGTGSSSRVRTNVTVSSETRVRNDVHVTSEVNVRNEVNVRSGTRNGNGYRRKKY